MGNNILLYYDVLYVTYIHFIASKFVFEVNMITDYFLMTGDVKVL